MNDRRDVLVTGSTGFIGTELCDELRRRHASFRHAVRSDQAAREPSLIIGDLSSKTDWSAAVANVRAVIHLAGRAHVYGKGAEHARRMHEVNAGATEALARAAAREGVDRLLYLSSTKVNGDISSPDGFRETDRPDPADDYARSKAAAEAALASTSGLRFTIVRTPLVYGPGVKANFLALMRAISRGVPLPLGRMSRNRRTLIASENLVDAILHVLDHPAAVGETFLVGDAETVSTRELCIRIGTALGRKPTLLPVPLGFMRAAGLLLGMRDKVERLLEDAAVDTTKIQAITGWRPPAPMDAALARTAEWYRLTRPRR